MERTEKSIKTNTEIFCYYKKGHPKRKIYEIEVSDEPYTNFKVGDKVYFSGNDKGYKTVQASDLEHKTGYLQFNINEGGHYLVTEVKEIPNKD